MDSLIILAILCYLASTVAYVAFLFSQRKGLNRVGLYVLVAGFVCHSLWVAMGFYRYGTIPAKNLFETLSISAWTLAGVFIFFHTRYRLDVLGVYAAPLVAAIMLVAAQLPREPLDVKNLFNSAWLVFHIIAIFIGEAALALACGVGILYLLQERAIKDKQRGFFFKRLPSLELLDATGYGCIVVGFTMLTAGLITGFIYAQAVWGRFWSWDPKEIWSGITWLIYAALLHQRLTVGWRGRRAAIMAIFGFAVIVFTFLGVNFLMEGHHGAFTRR
jgi:cytochrome c-type biogenesis protein CcsB